MQFQSYNDAAQESVRDAVASPSAELRFFERVVELIPSTILVGDVTSPIEASMLTLNTFQLLLAAGRIALTGHASAVFPVLRAALESSCYAFMITETPAFAQVWTERHESNTKMDKCRRTFANPVKAFSEACSWTAERKQRLLDCYQAMIDYGAHPNPRSIFHALTVDDGGDHWLANLHSVYEPDSPMTQWLILACADSALSIAAVIAECHRKNDVSSWNAIHQCTAELATLQNAIRQNESDAGR